MISSWSGCPFSREFSEVSRWSGAGSISWYSAEASQELWPWARHGQVSHAVQSVHEHCAGTGAGAIQCLIDVHPKQPHYCSEGCQGWVASLTWISSWSLDGLDSWYWTFRFHNKRRGISWPPRWMLVILQGLYSMQLGFQCYVPQTCICDLIHVIYLWVVANSRTVFVERNFICAFLYQLCI